jgi:hypothetical protein
MNQYLLAVPCSINQTISHRDSDDNRFRLRTLTSLRHSSPRLSSVTDNTPRVRGGYVSMGTCGHGRHAPKARFAGKTGSQVPGRARRYRP